MDILTDMERLLLKTVQNLQACSKMGLDMEMVVYTIKEVYKWANGLTVNSRTKYDLFDSNNF